MRCGSNTKKPSLFFSFLILLNFALPASGHTAVFDIVLDFDETMIEMYNRERTDFMQGTHPVAFTPYAQPFMEWALHFEFQGDRSRISFFTNKGTDYGIEAARAGKFPSGKSFMDYVNETHGSIQGSETNSMARFAKGDDGRIHSRMEMYRHRTDFKRQLGELMAKDDDAGIRKAEEALVQKHRVVPISQFQVLEPRDGGGITVVKDLIAFATESRFADFSLDRAVMIDDKATEVVMVGGQEGNAVLCPFNVRGVNAQKIEDVESKIDLKKNRLPHVVGLIEMAKAFALENGTSIPAALLHLQWMPVKTEDGRNALAINLDLFEKTIPLGKSILEKIIQQKLEKKGAEEIPRATSSSPNSCEEAMKQVPRM